MLILGVVISGVIISQISYREDKPLESRPSQPSKSSASAKNWTFMVYLDADNNLESAGIDDLNEMEMEGSTSDINVIVQIDRISGYDSSNGDWNGAKRYYITKDYSSGTISSTVVQDLGEVNMGLTSTLQNFIQWGKSNYPADNYALILWDHGSGIMYGSTPGGVCWDDSNSHDYLTLSEIKSVLSNPSYAVNLVGFDACLMGAVEVHYQLKDCVDVIIGSEELEPGDGYPYNDIINYLKNNPSATPQQLGQQIVIKYDNSYSYFFDDVTQAAANAMTAEFVDSLQDFITDLDIIAVTQKSNIQNARSNSLEFHVSSYIDLYDFADEIQSSCTGSVDSSAQFLMDNITNIIIEERHSISNIGAEGLSIYFPETQSGYSTIYETSDFATDLQWDEFLFKYYTGQTSNQYDDEYEENDILSQASILTQGNYYNLICNGSDYDLYNVSLETGNTIDVKILFNHDEGDLDLTLYNPSLVMVSISWSSTDNEHLSYNATESGYHVILVDQCTPYQQYQPYDLIISVDSDDSFEQNDIPYSSAFINNNTLYTDLVCIDYDFYYFWAKENYLINVTIEFNYPDGDLDLYLYDNYLNFLGASYTATNHENILFNANYSGWYVIWVYNYSNNLKYSLSANVSYVDDPFETSHGLSSNNYIDYSTPISYGDYADLVCMNNDFYNITLNAGTWINLTLYFDNDEGDLDIYLINVTSWAPFNYSYVGFSRSFTDNEFIYYEVDTSGYYYLWVIPYEFNFNYTLCIHETTLVWDDEFENNDWFDEAAKLNIGETYNNLTAIDWDTYYFYFPNGYLITITLDYNYSQGDLDLFLIYYDDINDIGWILDLSASLTDQEQITYEVQNSNYYHILIYPNEINMEYNLTLTKQLIPTVLVGGGNDDDDDDDDEEIEILVPIIIIGSISAIGVVGVAVVAIYLIRRRRLIRE